MDLNNLPITSEIINIIKEFSCDLYDYTKQSNIHEVITIHFGNKAKPKPSQKPVNCMKCIEPNTFPLFTDVLIQHIK